MIELHVQVFNAYLSTGCNNNLSSLSFDIQALGMQGNFKDSLAVLNKGIKIAQDKDLKVHIRLFTFK